MLTTVHKDAGPYGDAAAQGSIAPVGTVTGGSLSAQLRGHLGGDHDQVVEIGEVENLQVHPLALASAYRPRMFTASAVVPATPCSRGSATSRPMAAARRAISASSLPTQSTNAELQTMDPGSRSAYSHACRTPANRRMLSATEAKGTLNSLA